MTSLGQKVTWRSPEEIVEIAFQRATVVMMNEAHNGWKRCIRTRQIGKRILPVAHQVGARHLAMEALYLPSVAEKCNATRRVPEDIAGYPAQLEMREFIQSALDLGWTLHAYEANAIRLLSDKHQLELSNSDDWTEIEPVLQSYQAELASMEFTNWREEQQAKNLIATLDSLSSNTQLLVWCGNSHHSRTPRQGWVPMGYQFQKLNGMNPFVIDQTRTVNFTFDHYTAKLVKKFAGELEKFDGTAGFLSEEAPRLFGQNTDADAFLLSTQNELE